MLIRLYMGIVSPFLGQYKCRFVPTCSVYAMESITRFGVLRGGWMSLKRLLKCHPWGSMGEDPVPPKQRDECKKR